MSRIRTIKPEWVDDEGLHEAGMVARLMSICLISMADDYGNGRAHVGQLAGRIFWAEENGLAMSREGLRKLVANGFLRLYEVRGQSYFHIENWNKHQRVDKPGKPRCPGLEQAENHLQDNDSGDSRDTLANIPVTPVPDRDQDQDQDQDQEGTMINVPCGTSPKQASGEAAAVFDYWKSTLSKKRARLTGGRRSKITARLKSYSVADIKKAIDGAAKSDFHQGANDSGKRFDDLTLICRSDEKLEAFMELAEAAPGRAYSGMAPVTPESEREPASDLDEVFGRFEGGRS